MIQDIFDFALILGGWWIITRIVLPKLGVPT